ncbi:expressed unknown protein [Seminavis robusta]|uniref:F-box domain-containing protein n=1 Tax=Seminavis robusta TaxID=568900 RepID=A0A9N8DIE0_9STRA|nr:expressed unknown protein [Seminavis robusta]|eukprot:Sro137_g064470.1 n/a (414) ;mRNA; f:78374-79615
MSSRPVLTLEGLSEDLQLKIFGHLNVLDLRVAACVCRHWNSVIKPLDLGLLVMTISGSNEVALLSSSSFSKTSITSSIVQRFAASPNCRKRKRYTPQTTRGRFAFQWPTCLAVGPEKQLYLSQYKVQGVLEFRPCPKGYQYRRTLASGRNLASPEGLVLAHNSLYVVSTQNATISRLSLSTGALLERAGPSHGMNGFWALWGMTISPCQRYLLIAGHICGEGDFRQPTDTPTGAILCLDLQPNGSFQRNQRQGTIVGYYAIPAPASLALNRPSDPQYCRHGMLHVSTFAPNATGGRRIQKFCLPKQQKPPNNHGEDVIRHWGWLQEADRVNSWGIAFSTKTDQVFLTSSNTRNSANATNNGGQILQLPTCGCHQLDLASNTKPPHAISCGDLTALVDGQRVELNQPYYVRSID